MPKIISIASALPGWKAVFFDEDDKSVNEWDIALWALVEKKINNKFERVVVPMLNPTYDSEKLSDCTELYNFVGIRGPADHDVAPYAKAALRKIKLLLEVEEDDDDEDYEEELDEIQDVEQAVDDESTNIEKLTQSNSEELSQTIEAGG